MWTTNQGKENRNRRVSSEEKQIFWAPHLSFFPREKDSTKLTGAFWNSKYQLKIRWRLLTESTCALDLNLFYSSIEPDMLPEFMKTRFIACRYNRHVTSEKRSFCIWTVWTIATLQRSSRLTGIYKQTFQNLLHFTHTCFYWYISYFVVFKNTEAVKYKLSYKKVY